MTKYFEDEHTELKRELIDEVKSEIIAFLNSDGGTIYVGVEDDGNIIGIKDDSSKDKIDLKLDPSYIVVGKNKSRCFKWRENCFNQTSTFLI